MKKVLKFILVFISIIYNIYLAKLFFIDKMSILEILKRNLCDMIILSVCGLLLFYDFLNNKIE